MNSVAVKEEDVSMLKGMFDHLDTKTIRSVLIDANGDVERAIDSLLNLAAIDVIDSPVPASPPKNEEKKTGNKQEDQDALLAAVR